MPIIYCHYLKSEQEALERAPYPGPLGLYLQQNISAKAWASWLEQQVKIINEKRLSLANAEDRKILKSEMCTFLSIPAQDQADSR